MSEIPSELKYTTSHEWVRTNDDGSVTVGITDHAQELLGDLVFVELPEVGAQFEAGASCAVVESVKAASDVYAPAAGEITGVNETLNASPEAVNQGPYGDGWLFTLRPSAPDALHGLLDAAAYQTHVDAEDA